MITKREVLTGAAAGAILSVSGLTALAGPIQAITGGTIDNLSQPAFLPSNALHLVWDQTVIRKMIDADYIDTVHASIGEWVDSISIHYEADTIVVPPLGLVILQSGMETMFDRSADDRPVHSEITKQYDALYPGETGDIGHLGLFADVPIYCHARDSNVVRVYRDGVMVASIEIKNVSFI